MPWLRALARAAWIGAVVVLSGCSTVERLAHPDRYIDLQFPVGKGNAQPYPHVVDRSGALWYIDGDRIVRATAPSRSQSLHDADVRSGRLFWYDGSVYVLDGDGTHLTRVGSGLHGDPTAVPERYAPAEGVIADSRHGWLVFAEAHPHELAVLDAWKWYGESIPSEVQPFAAALAGGPHGKKYLVVADASKPLIAVKNRSNGRSALVALPQNACFGDGDSAWRVPPDVRGRDDYRTWATAGEHVASIDLTTKHVLRVWDLAGCAMRILRADGNAATILVGSKGGNGFTTSIVRVDREGVHELGQYGRVDGLASGAWIDPYDRLWWYDAKAHAFVCRTPLA